MYHSRAIRVQSLRQSANRQNAVPLAFTCGVLSRPPREEGAHEGSSLSKARVALIR